MPVLEPVLCCNALDYDSPFISYITLHRCTNDNCTLLSTGVPMTTKIYYLSVTFINKGSQTAVIKWTEPGGKEFNFDIPPNSQQTKETMFTSVIQPPPTQIMAAGKETNATIPLNSKGSVEVTPKENKETITVILGEGRFIFRFMGIYYFYRSGHHRK